MSEKSLVATLALVCALTLAATPVLAAPGAPSDAAPALTTEAAEAAEAPVTVDPFPTLRTWLTPTSEGLGYCYHDCSTCIDSSQCGGFPCTSVPAC